MPGKVVRHGEREIAQMVKRYPLLGLVTAGAPASVAHELVLYCRARAAAHAAKLPTKEVVCTM